MSSRVTHGSTIATQRHGGPHEKVAESDPEDLVEEDLAEQGDTATSLDERDRAGHGWFSRADGVLHIHLRHSVRLVLTADFSYRRRSQQQYQLGQQ